jgi:hypothetical protein
MHIPQLYHRWTADRNTLRHQHTGYLLAVCICARPCGRYQLRDRSTKARQNVPKISSTTTACTCLFSPPACCAMASTSDQYHSFDSALLSGVKVPFPSGIFNIPSITISSPSRCPRGGLGVSLPCLMAVARVLVMNPLFTRTVVGCDVGSSLVRWNGWMRLAPGVPSYTLGPISIGGSKNRPLRRTLRN